MMYSFFIIVFLLALFFAFYIPGEVLLFPFRLSRPIRFPLSLTLGIIFWSLQGMVFGYIGLRQLTYVYLLFFFLGWLYKERQLFKQNFFPSFRQSLHKIDYLLVSIIAVGVLVQMVMVFAIGTFDSSGLSFCCFWPDSLYHLALTNELVFSFPPIEPGMSGMVIHNYHYLANISIAELIRIFNLPLLETQYRFIPFTSSILLGLVAISFAKIADLSRTFTRWFVFFLFFSGDIYFLLPLVLGKGFHIAETLPERATTLWFSPPRFFALVIMLALLSFVILWIKKKSAYTGTLVAILTATLIGFKIYIAVFAIVGFGILSLYKLWKRDFSFVIPSIVLVLLLAGLYLPINAGAGGLFFVGFWRFENFAIRPEIDLLRFELARQIYFDAHNYIRVVAVDMLFLFLYTIAFFGAFLLGFIQTKKSLKTLPGIFHIYMFFGFFVSVIAGYFFLQTTGGANTVQFLFNAYFAGSLYLALFCSYVFPRLPKQLIFPIIGIFCVLVSTRVLYESTTAFQKITQKQGYLTISNDQLDAFHAINTIVSKQKIVALPIDIAKKDKCYYHSFLLQQQLYLCGSGILGDHGVDTGQRITTLTDLGMAKTYEDQKTIANNAHIDYLLVPNTTPFLLDKVHTIYQNPAYTLISY